MNKSVSLVLSSGGARGVAHIGVIEEMERQGFAIKSVAGSSMGALVGGVYASGNLKVFTEWMCKLDKKAVFNLIDFTFGTNGIVKGDRVIKELNKIVPDINIEDLPIIFKAIATDIKNKKEVIFEKGSLHDAIRASISIPTVLTPFILDEMVLIDGGVLNPLPINRVKRNENDLLIAVDVNASLLPKKKITTKTLLKVENELSYFSFIMKKGFQFLPTARSKELNYYTLLSQSASLMIQQISRMSIEMYKPDIVIKIPMNSFGPFHFYKSEEIIKLGEEATRDALVKFYNEYPSRKRMRL